MTDNDKKKVSGLVIGGGLLIGIGVGFLFLPDSPFLFVGSTMIGLGGGLCLSFLWSR